MKMVLLNYYVSMHAEVIELLAGAGVNTFTRIPEVQGRTSSGETRENTHVWPGTNSTLFAVVGDDSADALIRRVEEFNEHAQGEGIDAYVMNVERSVVAGP
jgi:nitrogen regulatory protein PII